MSKYNISAGGAPRWRECPRAMISISHGNRNLVGDKFEALLSWTAHRFHEVIINVSDTLYRHNLMAEGYSEELSLSMAERNGNIWLKEHHHIIKPHLPKILSMHRWNDWRQHRMFPEINAGIQDFYQNDSGLQQAVNDDCQAFLDRKLQQGFQDLEPYRIGSRNYLLEELAAYTIIGRQYQANRIYPAKDLKCFEYMRTSNTVPVAIKGLELTTHIHANFKKKSPLHSSNDNRKAA